MELIKSVGKIDAIPKKKMKRKIPNSTNTKYINIKYLEINSSFDVKKKKFNKNFDMNSFL